MVFHKLFLFLVCGCYSFIILSLPVSENKHQEKSKASSHSILAIVIDVYWRSQNSSAKMLMNRPKLFVYLCYLCTHLFRASIKENQREEFASSYNIKGVPNSMQKCLFDNNKLIHFCFLSN